MARARSASVSTSAPLLAGLVFANAVGQAADEQEHHPRIVVEYRWVDVSWTTHVIHGRHRNDVVMVAKTDALYLAR